MGNLHLVCLAVALILTVFQFDGHIENTRHYRKAICTELLQQWDRWEDNVLLWHGACINSDTYKNSMVYGKGWASACEIQVASNVLCIVINVWLQGETSDGRPNYTLSSFTPETTNGSKLITIYLLLHNGHFQLLEKRFDTKTGQTSHDLSSMQLHAKDRLQSYANAVKNTPLKTSVKDDQKTSEGKTQTNKRKSITNDIKIQPQTKNKRKEMYTGLNKNAPDHIYTVPTRNITEDRHAVITDPQTVLKDHAYSRESSGQAHSDTTAVSESPAVSKLANPPVSSDDDIRTLCRKFGVPYDPPLENETDRSRINRRRRMQYQISKQTKVSDIPNPPPLSNDPSFDKAMDAIRAFEISQMSYSINYFTICHERRIEMKMAGSGICKRCKNDKHSVKMFSHENNMNPGKQPPELTDLTVVEEQMLCRISPCINVHMLKHGGLASNGHCVTFPQEVNEPASILPRLPQDVQILKVRKQGVNDTSKDFRVRRYKIQHALEWLKEHNCAYGDIQISSQRIQALPLDGEIDNIATVEFKQDTTHEQDMGPADQQTSPCDDIEGTTNSSVLLPEPPVDFNEKITTALNEAVRNVENNSKNQKKSNITIPWPSRSNKPMSEFTTQNFFTLAFPSLFPFGQGDFFVNRPRTCASLSDWADHLLWIQDGRFAKHQYFKFVIHNMIMRKRAIEMGNFVFNQQLEDGHLSLNDLKNQIKNGDVTTGKKLLYFGASLRGSSQYWAQRGKELRSLIQFKINEGSGLPSFFTTGSCAEFHFPSLKRLLTMYVKQTNGENVDLDNRNTLFKILQENTHVVAHYFDLRTTAYFKNVMKPVFGVDTYWYRQEFAKSRGMVHWHGLCWRADKEPHNLLYEAVKAGLTDDQCAAKLSLWASSEFGMSASHPAGKDENGEPNKRLWPPPEGTAPPPPDDVNPLQRLLMDVSSTQETLLEDYLLLCNRFNLHRCSESYCLKQTGKSQIRKCRMEFPKPIRMNPSLVHDKNKSLRLEMTRDHPVIVQNSRFHTQGWRANGDVSLILSKSSPENPSVNEIIATEKYITGYACKGNQPTGAIADLFNDMVNCADETTGATAKSLCMKLLIQTVKRDVSAVEVSYELSSLPLYRSSHTFQSLSLSGARIFQPDGLTLTKNTPLDRYLSRDKTDRSSLYSYVCKRGKVPVISGSCHQASWPLDKDFCRTALLLHFPNWRNLSDIKDTETSWIDAFGLFLQSDACPAFVKADVERAKQHHERNDKYDDEDNNEENEGIDQPEWMGLIRPNPDFDVDCGEFVYDDGGPDHDWNERSYEYPADLGKDWQQNAYNNCNKADDILDFPEVDPTQMNQDQLYAFNIVMQTLDQYINKKDSFSPLRMIVSGTAGSGKSYLIKCLVKAVRSLYRTNKSVQVVCPTGNSANLISGVTLHSFLKLPTMKMGKEMQQPEGAIGEALQSNCNGVHVLLIDERSLIGATTLGWMEFMCRYGMNAGSKSDQSWGGLPVVVFFGDDVQLPPVLDSPVYHCNSNKPAAMHGVLVWQEFDTAVHLKNIIRQGNEEQQFRDVLMALREYNSIPQQARWLQSFQWNNLRVQYGEKFLCQMSADGLFVFPTHAEEWLHNKSKLLQENILSPIAKCNAKNEGPHSKSGDSKKAGGLMETLYLCKHAKVMLAVNLCVPYGLFNGAMGKVVDIIYLNGRKPQDSLPDVVMVEFPGYRGPPFLKSNGKVVPIVPVQRPFDFRCFSCKRVQIPLRLGWATTIHRCQGMTIGSGEANRYIVINPGTRQFESRNPGALFVALSRAKSSGATAGSYPDFAWHPSILLNEDRVCHKVNTPTTRARAKEIIRIGNIVKQTYTKYAMLQNDMSYATSIQHEE